MRARATPLVLLLLACGATRAPVVEPTPPTPTEEIAPPLFAAHGPLVLRSVPPTREAALAATSPPFYAELAADGSVTGTRCGATRFSDEGVLEREGSIVARVVRDGDVLRLLTGTDVDLGWRVEGDVLVAGGATRFPIASGSIAPSDPQLPAITIAPADAPSALVLAFFAALLVCDDVGP